MDPNPLRIEHLTFSYTDTLVLDNLNLTLVPGEMVVLLGANGAGKTTLLRTIARQLEPDSGTIWIDESDIHSFTRRSLAQRVSLMPQFEHRDTSLTVHEVVMLGRAPHAGWYKPWSTLDASLVRESLETTGMWGLRDRTLDTLSGGEWRRMILARSLAQQARVLLLDEPTAGLDLRYQYESLRKIRMLVKSRQLIALLSIHDLQQSAMFGDKIVLLASQRLIAFGAPSEVLTAPLLEQAFGIRVQVFTNPINGLPTIVPVET
ncbi:ABC transporter ATP-binding protein [Pirellulaceae bacterium SH467]